MFRIVVLTLALAAAAGETSAQRGTGEATGVARDAAAYDVRGLAGALADTKVGACESTTGRAVEGAHLVVTLPDGQDADVHLGPTGVEAVDGILAAAEVGDAVEARVFRTDAMPAGAFAAVTVTLDDGTFRLRDSNLRPDWARGPAGGGAGRGGAAGRGPGGGRCWWELPNGG